MTNALNLTLGTCTVVYNGVDLGHTKGPVVVTYEPEYSDVTADLYGTTLIDQRLKGEKFSAKIPLAEMTIANMKVAIPNATFAGAANARVLIGQRAGQSLAAVAYSLVLHPIAEGTRKYDIVMYKAVINSTIELNHSIDDQKVIEAEFVALIDETKSQGNYLGMIGDSTL